MFVAICSISCHYQRTKAIQKLISFDFNSISVYPFSNNADDEGVRQSRDPITENRFTFYAFGRLMLTQAVAGKSVARREKREASFAFTKERPVDRFHASLACVERLLKHCINTTFLSVIVAFFD